MGDEPATDELSAPLGQTKKPAALKSVRAVPYVIAGSLASVLVVFAGWAMLANDPLGGEPVAIVSTRTAPTAGAGAPAPVIAAPAPAAPTPPPPGETQTVTIIDGSSGQRQQVTIPASAADSNSSPDAGPTLAQEPGTEPRQPAFILPDLVETSRHGPLPKVGPDGLRPSEAYARRERADTQRRGARVAIVVNRMGLSASATGEALAKLPGPVTFGFVPYATDLERWAARARGEGHEVLLQVPMEPLDYPDNDAGPQTLLTSLSATQNLERLHWSMSRFQGYVGLTNYMGARFTGHDAGLRTVLTETGKRGLVYFDDGSSGRGRGGQIAAGVNTPFVRADVVIDAAPTAAEIDAALARLEATARERGLAVGSANAQPLVIGRIERWIKAAEARGIVLVPVTAVVPKPKSS